MYDLSEVASRAASPPVFSPVYYGGYLRSGSYVMTPAPLPDWSIITHTSGTHAGKIEFQTNMFLRKGSLAGNEPSVDLFKSFVEFVDPADTEGTCTFQKKMSRKFFLRCWRLRFL